MLFRGPKGGSSSNSFRRARRVWRDGGFGRDVAAEVLEERILLAAAVDDRYEDNDIKSRATNLGTLAARKTITGLQMRDAADWYKFTMQGRGTAADYARINFSHRVGNLTLELYDSRGMRIGRSATATNLENISLNGLAAGTYFVKVLGVGAAKNSYSMIIDPATLPPDDALENNDTFATARNLGTVTTSLTRTGLIMSDSADYYRFTLSNVGAAHSYLRVAFNHSQGDLDIDLYTASGTLVRRSVGQFDVEEVSLAGLGPGDYVLKVSGYQGAFNPSYSLTINRSQATPPTSGSRVLYVHFDGIMLSNSRLRDWAGDDWESSVFSYLDSQGDGLLVNPYEQGNANRDLIINGIIANLAFDLAPFGVVVQKVTTAQVLAGVTAGQGATTLFFGLTNDPNVVHVACDIDYANNNRTDIAFISDEADAWGNVADAITAASDVALHEAGHTFGLHHVNVAQFGFASPESMGLRYSVPQTQWLEDTSFMDAGFPEYIDHGGRLAGNQNTYRTMMAHFGRSATATKRFDLAPNLAQQHILSDLWGMVLPQYRPGGADSHDHDHDHEEEVGGGATIPDGLSPSPYYGTYGSYYTTVMPSPGTSPRTIPAPSSSGYAGMMASPATPGVPLSPTSRSSSGSTPSPAYTNSGNAFRPMSSASSLPVTLDAVFAQLSATGGFYAGA